MESAQATAGETRDTAAALETYQRLTAEQVIADLPNLGVDELLLVESLEQAGAARDEVLDRIDELLCDEADHAEPAQPVVRLVPPDSPAPPRASMSEDLLDQMGGLLERAAARRVGPVDAAAPAPVLVAAEPIPEVISPGRRWWRVGVKPLKVLVGLILVAVSGLVGARFLGQRAATSTAGRVAATPVAATPVAGTPAAQVPNGSGDPLAPRLLATVAGYRVQPDAAGAAGPEDLARVAKDDGGPEAQQVLTKDGFVRGYQRVWTNTPQRQIVVSVYQFRDAAGAVSYAGRRMSADRAALKGSGADIPVPGIPGAVGISSTANGGSSASAVFARDGYVVRLVVTLPSPEGEAATVQQVAARQWALL